MSLFDFFRKKSRKSGTGESETAGEPMSSYQGTAEPGNEVPEQHEVPEQQTVESADSMDRSLSISRSISKDSVLELSGMPDEPGNGIRFDEDSISGERILKGDVLLKTYEVISDAVRGGMGSVWKVRHGGWNTDLAMKRPQPRFFSEGSEKRKENFVRECEAWINLGLHPNIVSCYYVREISGVPTIFSEWMENGSLKNRIEDGSLYEVSEEDHSGEAAGYRDPVCERPSLCA